jgi:hypothetical protein
LAVKGDFAIAAQQPIVNVGSGHSMRRRKNISPHEYFIDTAIFQK